MPANLPPEYYKAEKWFRSVSTSDEKILALENMLRVIPKHKGTDHIRADLRGKLSKFKNATQKKTAKHADIFHVPKTGAGQVVFLGVANSGKSSIVAALTNAKVNVAGFPFATAVPVPGMMKFEDIQIQLVDMPPISAEFVMPGQVGTYRNCDLIGIVIDSSGDITEQMKICTDFLESRNLLIDEKTPAYDKEGNVLGKKFLYILTKSDATKPQAAEMFRKCCKKAFGFIKISTQDSESVKKLARKLFEMLNIIRVYSKPPGKQADMNEPFTLPAGATVMKLAKDIHRELAEKLKYARIWGTGVYDGQNVQLNHILKDKDIIELHFS